MASEVHVAAAPLVEGVALRDRALTSPDLAARALTVCGSEQSRLRSVRTFRRDANRVVAGEVRTGGECTMPPHVTVYTYEMYRVG